MFSFLKALFRRPRPPASAPAQPPLFTPADLAAEADLTAGLRAWFEARPEIRAVAPVTGGLRLHYPDRSAQPLFLAHLRARLAGQDGAAQEASLARFLVSPLARFLGPEGRLLPLPVAEGAAADDPPGVLMQPMAAGLAARFLRVDPAGEAPLTRADLSAMGLDEADLWPLARAHLTERIAARGMIRHEQMDGRLHVWQLDGRFEAGLAFLPDLWEREARDFQAPPAVGFLARDTVVAVSSNDPEAMEELVALARRAAADLPAFLAPHLYLPDGQGGWRQLRAVTVAPPASLP